MVFTQAVQTARGLPFPFPSACIMHARMPEGFGSLPSGGVGSSVSPVLLLPASASSL